MEAKKTEIPQPFPQSAQYKKTQRAAADDDELAEPPAKPKKSKGLKKKSKKRPAQIKQAAATSNDVQEVFSQEPDYQEGEKYSPNRYSYLKKSFVDEKVAAGTERSQAQQEWNQSTIKRQLLSTISLAELKRRKFVTKECEEHPWAA